jgi:hypothetical protein
MAAQMLQVECAVQLVDDARVAIIQRYTHMNADDLRQQVAGLPGNGLRL